jgi:hypothetical protein
MIQNMTPDEQEQAWRDISWYMVHERRWRFRCLLWFGAGMFVAAMPFLLLALAVVTGHVN